jgi:hypothetical protein
MLEGDSRWRSHFVKVDFALSLVKSEVQVAFKYFESDSLEK